MFTRTLSRALPKSSFFLFGPRQVGKTTLLEGVPDAIRIDLLDPDEQLAFNKSPNLLRERLSAAPQRRTVVIDEIQRVPRLLDVVQSLFDHDRSLRFIMSGSSARKLRSGQANLLGGRIRTLNLHPLTAAEIGGAFRLDQALTYGTLPRVAIELGAGSHEEARAILKAYVTMYLREEIKAEALVRSLHGFQNFLDVAAAQFAEQVNFSAVSRECQVAYATVREFYSILEDTLVGFFLKPHARSERKRMSLAPKFYFFDNGVTRAALHALPAAPNPAERGRLFEQWFIQEVNRLNDYGDKDWMLSFWRTSHGAEVDLLIERAGRIIAAFESKSTPNISAADLSGLKAFSETHANVPLFVAAPVKAPRKIGDVTILDPLEALAMLEKRF
ncbi:MAG: ATP-binding protein [Deltaproteobacteria bacterium]|nr:ATP-binding protein [Deltaproteobacteria bacterium]